MTKTGNYYNPRKGMHAERDAAIRKEKAELGVSITFLARKYGISVGRMAQIVSPNWPAYEVFSGPKEGRAALGLPDDAKLSDIAKRMQELGQLPETEAKGQDMAQRTFLSTKRNIDGKWQTGLQVKCAKALEGCIKHDEIYSAKDGGTPAVLANKKFIERGWHLGGGPHADICPNCWNKAKELRAAVQADTKPFVPQAQPKPAEHAVNNVALQHKPSAILTGLVENRMATVPQPSQNSLTVVPSIDGADRTVKKLINDKLHEVYPELDAGYAPGWSDRRVATDLGAKVEWVAYIREEMFGPETKPKVDFSKQLAELDEKGKVILDTAKQVTAMMERLDQFDKTFNTIIAKFDVNKEEWLKAWNELKRQMQQHA